MALTSAQKATLKSDIAANTTTISVLVDGQGDTPQQVQIKNVVGSVGDNWQRIATWYNLPTAYLVWRNAADKLFIDSLIVKSSYTPNDAAPASTNSIQGTNDALLYQNRALVCQLKQSNALWLTGGVAGTINASLASLRQNFQDCLRQIPSGASGVNQDAGWGVPLTPGNVRLGLMRAVNNVEKLFVSASTGPGTDGVGANRGTITNPDAVSFDGTVSAADVSDAVTFG